MVKACVAVIEGEPEIKPLIPRPITDNLVTLKLFKRIMTNHDLGRYTLAVAGGKINVVVFEDNLKDFMVGLVNILLGKCHEAKLNALAKPEEKPKQPLIEE